MVVRPTLSDRIRRDLLEVYAFQPGGSDTILQWGRDPGVDEKLRELAKEISEAFHSQGR